MDKTWFGLSILLFSVTVFVAIIVACLKSKEQHGRRDDEDDDS